MKNANKKTIVKFTIFVIIFAAFCMTANYIAGEIMNKEILNASNIFGTVIGSVLFGYYIFFKRSGIASTILCLHLNIADK